MVWPDVWEVHNQANELMPRGKVRTCPLLESKSLNLEQADSLFWVKSFVLLDEDCDKKREKQISGLPLLFIYLFSF